jgi:hypothetical protein
MKPEKRKKIMAPKSKSDDEMSVQVICAPQRKPKKKSNNTSDVSGKEMEYQKELKLVKISMVS